jgi:hypothetical protein
MTVTSDFDRLVASWLESAGPSEPEPETVRFALAAARRTGQRAGLRARLAGADAWPTRRSDRIASRSLLALVLLALLAAATAAALLVVGSRPEPIRLHGDLTATGSLHTGLLDPSTLVLDDGRVLVAGATTDLRLHAEIWDPARDAFTVVAGLDDQRFSHGQNDLGLTRLPDGSVLAVMRYASSQSGATEGGYALRIDLGSGGVRQVDGFRGADVPDVIAAFGFASWPSEIRADGRVAWTPARWRATDTVTYDPATDRFATEAPDGAEFKAPLFGASGAPPDDTIVLLHDGRYVLVGEAAFGGYPALVIDPPPSGVRPLNWPLIVGGEYAAELLRDGRVLIAGPTTGIFDPSSDRYIELPVSGVVEPLLSLDDGRLLVSEDPPAPFGSPDPPPHLLMFDPATTAFARFGPEALPDPRSSWTRLPDGRVLVIREDVDASPDAGRAWILR